MSAERLDVSERAFGDLLAIPDLGSAAGLLDDVVLLLRRFVVLSDVQADAITLWILHTHSLEAADCTPYLYLSSAEKRSGKTRCLEVMECLVREPLPAANISDAALFRAIAELSPTLLLDEIDAIFGPKARDREDLRGMLNAGYRRGAVARRMGGPKMTTLEAFPVFCAKVFAGIGDLPDTIADRSIPIRLARRTREEPVERFRRREVVPAAESLRDRLADWCQPQIEELRAARPDLPDELDDRAQDVWEPLLALGDLAGGDWPQRARRAAMALSAAQEREDDSMTSRLLGDLHHVFETSGIEHFRTADLIDELGKIEESPWGDWHGKPITAHALSRLLRPHRIKTMPVWIDGRTVRGYKLDQFTDAFHRVLGVRSVSGVRSDSRIEAAPNAPNAPNAYSAKGEQRGLILGDPMYPVALADAAQAGHISEDEFAKALAVHKLVERGEAA
jgi:Protein of unknown function (DUF3631)